MTRSNAFFLREIPYIIVFILNQILIFFYERMINRHLFIYMRNNRFTSLAFLYKRDAVTNGRILKDFRSIQIYNFKHIE